MLDYIPQAIQVDFGRITRVNRSKSSNSLSLSKYHLANRKETNVHAPMAVENPMENRRSYIISLVNSSSRGGLCHGPSIVIMAGEFPEIDDSPGFIWGCSGVNPQGRNNLVQFDENGSWGR